MNTSDDAPAPVGSSDTRTRGRRKQVTGIVASDKMQKTRTVRVQRLVKHKLYGKYVRRRSTFYVHDEEEVSREGDTVLIAATRPLSRLKRWRLVKVVSRPAGTVEKVLADEVPPSTRESEQSGAAEEAEPPAESGGATQ